jgi:Peptidase S24-like
MAKKDLEPKANKKVSPRVAPLMARDTNSDGLYQSAGLLLEGRAQSASSASPSRIKPITARGDSMSGTIEDGDVLFVDSSVQAYAGEGVYAIAIAGEAQVKRLQRLIGGGHARNQ